VRRALPFAGGRFNPNKNAVALDQADLVGSLVEQRETVPPEASRRSLSAATQGGQAPASSHIVAAKETMPDN